MVTVELVDDPGSKWIARIRSSEEEDEEILVAHNGAIVVRMMGYDQEVWAGFASEGELLSYDDDGGEDE